MSRQEDTRERRPGHVFRPRDPTTQYWVRDGRIYYRDYPLHGADVATFRFFLGGFGKDCKHGYRASSRIRGSDGPSFLALNLAYATDGTGVWTMDSAVKDADASTFVVCDDGYRMLTKDHRSPSGFAKDAARVYHYDHQGKPRWVRKADPASFVSLNDGTYGRDDSHIFCRAIVVLGADTATWRLLESDYSADHRRVYYDGRRLSGADAESFEIVCDDDRGLRLAKDRQQYYWTGRIVDEADFLKLLAEFEEAASG